VNGETIKLLNHPVRYDNSPPPNVSFALQPGTHTRQILAASGFADSEINSLISDDVVFAAA